MIQAAMGWEDYHLHAFEIDGERYGVPDPEEVDDDVIDEGTAVLSDVTSGQTRFYYEYDFGDFWRHEVVVESVDPVPMVLKEWHRVADLRESGAQHAVVRVKNIATCNPNGVTWYLFVCGTRLMSPCRRSRRSS